MKTLEIISFETVSDTFQVSAGLDGYELAVDFKIDETEELNKDPYIITWSDVLFCGEPIEDVKTRDFYLTRKEELVKEAVKQYLS